MIFLLHNFKEKQIFLNILFRILSNPYLKANLPNAWKVTKDFKKIESKNINKYMLLLIDGYY